MCQNQEPLSSARATVVLNGVIICQDLELNPPKWAAARLGEAPTGPLMLQRKRIKSRQRTQQKAEKRKLFRA